MKYIGSEIAQLEKDIKQAKELNQLFKSDLVRSHNKVQSSAEILQESLKEVILVKAELARLGLDKVDTIKDYDKMKEQVENMRSENKRLNSNLRSRLEMITGRAELMGKLNDNLNRELKEIENKTQSILNEAKILSEIESQQDLNYLNIIAALERRKIEEMTKKHIGFSEDTYDEIKNYSGASVNQNKMTTSRLMSPIRVFSGLSNSKRFGGKEKNSELE